MTCELDFPSLRLRPFSRNAAIMTFNSDRVDVPLCFFVVPLLVAGLPDLPFPTVSAIEYLVDVEVRQRTVGVYVIELSMVRRHRRRVIPLLIYRELCDALGRAQFPGGGVASCR